MRERLPLERLLLEIAEDDASEKSTKSRMVSQDEIQEMIARKRAAKKSVRNDDAES